MEIEIEINGQTKTHRVCAEISGEKHLTWGMREVWDWSVGSLWVVRNGRSRKVGWNKLTRETRKEIEKKIKKILAKGDF